MLESTSLQKVQPREQEKEILYCELWIYWFAYSWCLGLYCVLVLLVSIQMVQDMDQHVSELSPNHAIVLYSDAYRCCARQI